MEANVGLSAILFSIAIFLGIVLFVILTWVNTNQVHSSRLLGLYVLLFNFFALHNLLIYTHLIEHLPYLYRTARIFSYAAGPLVFLYIRSVLFGEQRFRRWDFLHFIPLVVYAVDLIPFFFVSPEEKLGQIYSFLQNENVVFTDARGWIPYEVHQVTVPLSIYLYLAASSVLIYRASKSKIIPVLEQNSWMFKWLITFWSLFFISFSLWFLVLIFPLHSLSVTFTQALIVALLSLSTGVALLFYPNILYGFQSRMPLQRMKDEQLARGNPDAAKDVQDESGIVLSDSRRSGYLHTLDQIMSSKRLYLNASCTLTEVAATANIPYYHLSAVINQYYGWNFNEYINWLRLNHFKQLMEQPDANQYTLEAIALRAGFGSRVTFARAFKKFEGCTPSEYLKRAEEAN